MSTVIHETPAAEGPNPALKRIAKHVRYASVLILLGLVFEFIAFIHWTPLTFIAFASVGLTTIFLGVAWYFIVVIGYLRRQKAL